MIHRLLIFPLFFLTLLTTPLFAGEDSPLKRLPSTIEMKFSGPLGVPAEMIFTHANNIYQITTHVAIPFKPIHFEVHGFISGQQFMPSAYQDIRSDRLYAYADFNYGDRIVLYGKSGEEKSAPLNRPTKDFFSLAWEMALNDGKLLNSVVATNGKKLYTRDQFRSIEIKKQSINGARTEVEIFSNGSGDDRIDLGFAKNHYNIPAIIAFYDKGRRYELRLTRVRYP